ncbi:MAG TPA: cupredoxin family copper-binding protein [Candidatus Saccharimonadales bacterium]|nr:cupredoxin family copper-binding protein [Candidatus Saccharimonadales bacterium]
MNKAIIAIVIVIIIAAGGWAIFGRGNKSNNSIYGSSNKNTAPVSNQSNNSASQSQGTGSVSIQNMMFTPSQVTVAKGAKVTWTNNDSVTHTVVDDLSNVGGPNSGDIAPGATYSFTFNKTGSYQYHCSIHPSMRGTIVVR